MEPAEIVVEIGTYGLKKLVVNGVEWTAHTKSVQVTADASAVPVVSVVMAPAPFEVRGAGVVMVQPALVDRKAAVMSFLSTLNPDELEGAALSGAGWGEASVGKLIVEKIIEIAEAQL